MSVRALASCAGFSPSFISQVENSQVSPSLASLERIAMALGVTLGGLFADAQGETTTVVRADERHELAPAWSSSRIESLAPFRTGSPLEAVMITIEPGGRSGPQPAGHPGKEFALCFDGNVRLTLNDDSQVLGRGDTVSFSSEMPHLWENCGLEAAQVLIVSPRFTH
jgi:transcriptional regulator with XRE-family HTH domain